MMNVYRFLSFIFLLFLISSDVKADCSGAPEGTINFNVAQNRLEYCDFNNWRSAKYTQTIENLTEVYNEDFESGIGSEWGTDYSVTLSTFLGRFGTTGGNQGPAKTFALSGTQDSTTITFDMYQIDAWPNRDFMVYLDDTEVIRTSYSDNIYSVPAGGSSGNVSWTITPLFPITFDMGFDFDRDDQVYQYSITVTNPTDTTMKIGFGSTLTTNASYGAFGIDNIVIDEVTGGTPSNLFTEDFEGGVPPNDWGAGEYSFDTTQYLGSFEDSNAAQVPNKTFTLAGPSIDSTEIQFDVYEMGTWDNEPFYVFIDDVAVYSTTFQGSSYQVPSDGSSGNVSWTVTNLTTQLIDLNGNGGTDQAYRYVFSYTNPGASEVKVGFGSNTNGSDEVYGIDNFSVTTLIGGTPTLQFSDDFETPPGANEWGDQQTFNFGSFLGRFADTSGQGPNQTFTLPGDQTLTTLTFDFYEIDSWDGESFQLYVDDALVFSLPFSGTVYETPADGSNGNASWTVTELTDFNADIGFGGWSDQAYRFVVTLSNPGDTSLKVGFGSTLDQPISDESAGVDNISIEHNGSGPSPVFSTNFTSSQDESAWSNHAPEVTEFTTFLGRHNGTGGTQDLNRSFTLSGAQATTTIAFDFYEIDSWDDEDFNVYLNDVLLFTDTRSETEIDTPASGTTTILGRSVTWTGTAASPILTNVAYGSWEDEATRYTITITNPSDTTLKLGFGATTNSPIGDESWGIDNVRVYETDGSSTVTDVYVDDFESGVAGWSDLTSATHSIEVTTPDPTKTASGVPINTVFTSSETEASPHSFVRSQTSFGGGVITTALGTFPSTGGGQGPQQTFTLPGSQNITKISFDFIVAGTWDDENFYFFVNDEAISQTYSYRDFNVKNQGTITGGVWRANNLTYSQQNLGWGGYNEIVRYTIYLTNPGETTVTLGFGSRTSDPLEEIYGIDNVIVEHFESSPASTFGACSSPGEFYYSAGDQAWLACNNDSVLTAIGAPGSGSGGCNSPTATAGALDFDSTNKEMRFCDGNGWVILDNWD